jgi:NADH-quinone oxidoreductase subunit F
MTNDRHPLTRNIRPGKEPLSLCEYEQAGGYQGFRKALTMSPHEVQDCVIKANLAGRGGGGFSTGRKWATVPMGAEARHPKYFVVNADEMEPGTMKDRILMEGDPHGVIEGTLLAAYAIQADFAYIFLRNEYALSARRLQKAIDEATQAHYAGKNVIGSPWSVELRLHLSAGRYMCGEKSGILGALQGKRAIPRAKPPRSSTSGLWGKPTVVNNVETLANVHHIVNNGWEWFKSLSLTEEGGTKLYGVSGHVKNPGVWEMPMGSTISDILNGPAGGMREGRQFRALLPGGASTAFLTEEHFNTPMDFANMEKTGSRLGTGTMIVLDDRTCPVGVLLSLIMFFARESCGWCTPCREGLPWVTRTLAAMESGKGLPADMDVLDSHIAMITDGSTFCELAPGAMMPLKSALKYFRKDFERHISEKRCPWRPA